MILYWMLYCTVVALLLGVAAVSLERVVRQRGVQVRGLWAAALVGSAVLPAAAYLLDARRAALALSRATPLPQAGSEVRAGWLMDPFAAVPEPAFDLDPWLLALWAALTGVALLSLGASYATLKRRSGGWSRRRVDGQEVWVAPDTGPAVVGFVRSRIVLPEWVLERGEAERAMVLAHESEHLRAGDPRLLLGALLVAAALPWNPALWWQWRRLRQAVEVDCDLRVLGRGLDARAYGRLLVEVTERGTARRLAVAALSESQSSLERRIRIMFTPRPRRWMLQAAAATVLAVGCVVVACTADIPSGPGSGMQVNASGAAAQAAPELAYEVAVLDRVPQLSNSGRIGALMEQLYPSLLKGAGIGGTVVTQFVVQADGTTDPASIKVLQSPREELSAASIAAVRAFTFRPGQYKGENVRTLIQMPITWSPNASQPVAVQDGRVEIRTSDPAAVAAAADRTRAMDDPGAAPNFAHEVGVLERVPTLANRAEIAEIMEELYPRLLQEAGIGGTVVTQFVIKPDGMIDLATLKVLESSREELNQATLKALERFKFTPGLYKGAPVRVLIQMPMTWQPKG
jgi:TonB family protein